jgi:hypothetical protein
MQMRWNHQQTVFVRMQNLMHGLVEMRGNITTSQEPIQKWVF